MVLVLVLVLTPMVWGQPYPIPPTCYTKVLSMGKEITQRAADIKKDHDTFRCAAHLPDLYIDVHDLVFTHDNCEALQHRGRRG
ncbi:hypothetical protein R3I94_015929 [Phoxinus phoxinus]